MREVNPEPRFSFLKYGIGGSQHKVSAKHLSAYLEQSR
jgi:hypothetical protein